MSSTNGHDPVASDAFVHLVADQLISGLRDDLEPALVHVTHDGPGRREIGVKPLEGRHPSDLLVGFTAPGHWHALGLATRGVAYHLSERGDAGRRGTRVHVVTLVSRTGEIAQRMHVPDDVDLAAALEAGADDATGEQIDLLRLALGLETDDPPCGTDVYWAIEWLSALLGADPEELTSWSAVTSHHPAMRVLDEDGAGSDDVVSVAAAFGRVCTWRRLRDLARDGRFLLPELVPSDGSWFDDGAFARFVLSRCPPLAMLRRQIGGHLPTDLALRLDRALDALDVPASAWPDVSGAAADR